MRKRVDGPDPDQGQLRRAGSSGCYQGERKNGCAPTGRPTHPPKLLLQDIFRKYPHSYEGIIPILCSNLDELDEPDAKASLIWIIGEYAEKIDNADELLSIFLDSFKEESYPVSVCQRMLNTSQYASHSRVAGPV
jgi:hypothetical protein